MPRQIPRSFEAAQWDLQDTISLGVQPSMSQQSMRGGGLVRDLIHFTIIVVALGLHDVMGYGYARIISILSQKLRFNNVTIQHNIKRCREFAGEWGRSFVHHGSPGEWDAAIDEAPD